MHYNLKFNLIKIVKLNAIQFNLLKIVKLFNCLINDEESYKEKIKDKNSQTNFYCKINHISEIFNNQRLFFSKTAKLT